MKRLLEIFIHLTLIPIAPIFCQNDINPLEALTLDDAWSIMKENNPSLQALLIDQQATLREINSKAHLIPGIGISSSISRSSPLISSFTNPNNRDINEGDNWSFRGGLDLRLGIETTLKIENHIKEIEYSLFILEKEKKIRDLKANLEKLFYQISTGEKTIKLQERILGLSQNRFNQVESLYKKGLRSEFEVLSARISVARDQPSLKKAQVQQEKRFIELRELLGFKPNQDITLVFPPDKGTNLKFDPETHDFNINNNKEYKIALLEVELSQINKQLVEKSQRNPSINTNLGWSTSLRPLFNSETWSTQNWSDSLSLGLSFSLPLDPYIKGSKDYQDILKLQDSIEKKQIALEGYKETVINNILSLLLDLDLSISNISVNELNIELQEKSFKKIQTNYENGISSLQNLDISRQELEKALLTLEGEKLNRNILLIELGKYVDLKSNSLRY